LVVLIGINANEMHKWTHRTKAENGRLLTWLQQVGLLQPPVHHVLHHSDPKNTHYCVLTNYLNPLISLIFSSISLEGEVALPIISSPHQHILG
jgi:ubiquitin-conjugating enzyme E2 variant